jgi:rare lipoprotein A
VVTEVVRGKRGNGPVYTVWGKSYRVMDSAEGFWQEGNASWYGTKFHGRETSSGEVFDIYKLTAAHKHLPLPSYVRVTNLDNGKQTVLRVNDRGPFHDDRIIDLSYAAAVKLGFHDKGTSPVRIEVLTPDAGPHAYMVQAGAFTELERADRSHRELQALTGFRGVVVKIPTDEFYRVRLGPVPADQVPRLQTILQAADYGKPKLIPAPAGAPAGLTSGGS